MNFHPERKAQYYQILFFLILAAGIIIAGYLYYQSYEREYKSEIENQLTSVGDLKVNELSGWWHERRGDADLLYQNPAFSSLVRELGQDPHNTRAQQAVLTWLSKVQLHYPYDRVYLLSPEGEMQISVPDTSDPVSSIVLGNTSSVLDTGKVTILDFYRNEYDKKIYLTILIPVHDEEIDARTLGIVGLQIDPEDYLYPFIKQWPTASSTAETLLIRRDGNEVLYLNELRFRPDVPLSYRLPLNLTDRPAVMAVLGQEGIVEGIDYQGLPVLANIRKIPDTPWYMVARINTFEIYQPLQSVVLVLSLIVLLLLLGTGGALFFLRQRESGRFYREQSEMKETLRESEQKFQIIADYTYDWETWELPDGRFVYVSPSCERISGYPPNAFTSDPAFIDTIVHPDDRGVWTDHKEQAASCNEVLSVDLRILHLDGTVIWINHTCHPIITESGINLGRRGSNRDVSERIRMIDEINASTRRYHDLVNLLPVSVFETDKMGNFTFFNAHAFTTYQYTPDDLTKGIHYSQMIIPQENDLAKARANQIFNGNTPNPGQDYHCIRKDGSIVHTIIYTAPIVQEGIVEGMRGVAIDMTETLIEKEKFSHIFYDSPTIMAISLFSTGRFIDVNHAFEHYLGYTAAEVIGKTSAELNIFVDYSQRQYMIDSLRASIPLKNYEVKIRKKDGVILSLLFSGDFLTISGEEIFFTQAVDVTDLKQIQQELAKKNEELTASYEELAATEEELRYHYDALFKSEENLRQTTEYLENLISYANVPILVWNPDFIITRVNHACENLIGRQSSEVVNKSLDILFPTEKVQYSMRLLETTRAGVRWDTVELDILHINGSIRTVLWNSSTLYSPDGLTPVATIAQGQDITLRKRLEEENEISMAQIQKNLAQLSILNDGIRNPLMVMLGATEIFSGDQLIETITEQVSRIDEMVTQLDQRWVESDKILSILRKNYLIYASPSADLIIRDHEERAGDRLGSGDDGSSLSPHKLLAEEIEAELYIILDSIDALIYVADLETYEILYLNRMGRSLFGDFTGKLCYQLIQKDQESPCPFCNNHLLMDLHGPTGVHISEYQNTRNGRWYECRDRAIRWKNQRLVHIQIATDITERKAVENALRESEYTSKKLFEESSDPILLMQEDRFIECNQAALDLLKIKEKEKLIGLTPVDISPEYQPDGRRSSEAAYGYNAQAHNEGHCRFEWMCKRSDEKQILLEVSLLLIMFKGEAMLHLTWRDVTERKKAEQALKTSEAFLNSIIEQSPSPLWVSDKAGTLIRLNQACRDMLRITNADVVGKYNIFEDNIVKEQGFMPLVRKVFETGEPVSFPLIYDSTKLAGLSLSDTVNRTLEVTIYPIRDSEGRFTNAVIQHNDITKRRWAEEALQKSEERFQTCIKKAPLPLCFVGKDGIFTYCNERFIQTFGYIIHDISTLFEWLFKGHMDETYCRQIIGTWEAEVKWAIEEHTNIEPREYTVPSKDGTLGTYIISGAPMDEDTIFLFIEVHNRK